MPSQSYLPKDLNDLRNWKAVIEKHLSTAALYGDVFNAEALLDLPRIRLDTVWYNFRDARYASANSLYNPGRFSTRFNPRPELGGGFGSLALAEDTSTATFELSRHLDLAETVQMLKRMALMQIRVRVNNVIDLTDPNTVASALGIDFGALTGMSFQDKVSVTQRICLTLVQSGCDGAVFPSTSTVGKKNLVLFADNIRSREPATVLSIKHLAAS